MKSADTPSPSTSSSSSRKRANKPKVRTGCLTCKQRRVKCDETKPSCINCTKSRRVCGGYEFDSQEWVDMLLEKRKQETTVPRQQQRGLLPASELSFVPSQAYDEDFITSQISFLETSREGPAIFGRSAWNDIVAEASQTHSYVRYAVATIDSLNKRVKESLLQGEKDTKLGLTLPFLSAESEFALQAYHEFLRGSRKAVSEGTQSTRMALICCFLIIGIEILLWHHNQATSQIWSCNKLLEAWLSSKSNADFSALESPDTAAVKDQLFQEIRLLDIEGNWLNDPRPRDHHEHHRLEGGTTMLHMPQTFESVHEARSYLELIIRRTHHFIRAVRTGKPSPDKEVGLENASFYTEFDEVEPFGGLYNDSAELLAMEKERYAQDIARWSSAFSLFFITGTRVANSQDVLASQLLKIRAAAIKIMLFGVLSTTELAYDGFLVEFREIVLLAREVLQNPEVIRAAPASCFITNSGVLSSLRLVAEKCRDRKTRCDAISLMKSTPWREGSWWSLSVAHIAEWLMTIEEEGLELWERLGIDCVPGWARARLISVEFRQDKSCRLAIYVCVKGSGGNARIREVEYMV